ncbi:Pyruvate kinase (EC [Olavius algarvensis associated proteobacterium Delta 3]|nr:Pyruvate kinase (EC [Olavius algarvensis associated proteobacterium Delta 3]CAB5132019.1 Pyruvate kinase (EC [Olavius algarvensis associated proteobacterium Delta 3]
MMRITGIMVLFLVLVAWPGSSTAEFYRYYDENGALRFTDNLAEVPEDQQPQVKRYQEEDDYLTPRQRAEKARNQAKAQIERENLEKNDRKTAAIRNVKIKDTDDLKSVREELDGDFAGLEDRRKALQAKRDSLTTPEEVREYQTQVRKLNEDIQRFEVRRQEFIRKAKEYNALVN